MRAGSGKDKEREGDIKIFVVMMTAVVQLSSGTERLRDSGTQGQLSETSSLSLLDSALSRV